MDGKDKFRQYIQIRVTQMFDEILTFAEVAVPNKYTYDKLRGRILKAGNNAIRDLEDSCRNYDIIYNPKITEVIEYEGKGEGNDRRKNNI